MNELRLLFLEQAVALLRNSIGATAFQVRDYGKIQYDYGLITSSDANDSIEDYGSLMEY